MPIIDGKFIVRITTYHNISAQKITTLEFNIEKAYKEGLRVRFFEECIFIPKFALVKFDKPLETGEFLSILESLVTDRKYGDYWVDCKSAGKGRKKNTHRVTIEATRMYIYDEMIQDSELITHTFTVQNSALRKTLNGLQVKSWVIRKKLKEDELLDPGIWENKDKLRQYIETAISKNTKQLKSDTADISNEFV